MITYASLDPATEVTFVKHLHNTNDYCCDLIFASIRTKISPSRLARSPKFYRIVDNNYKLSHLAVLTFNWLHPLEQFFLYRYYLDRDMYSHKFCMTPIRCGDI